MLTKGTADKVKKFGDDPKHEKLVPGYGSKAIEPQHPNIEKIKNFIK